MDAIKSYLNNMFSRMPQSREVLRAKEELLQMMEDKYTQLRAEGRTENEAVGQVISEFGNLEELAEQLGISREVTEANDPDAQIAMSEAEVANFIAESKRNAYRFSAGIVICILSPVVLIMLKVLDDQNFIAENLASAIGVGVLLAMIGIGVYFFVTAGVSSERYEELEHQLVNIPPQVHNQLRAAKEAYRPVMARMISIGVGLILLGLVAVTTIALLEMGDLQTGLAVVFLLVMVSVAVGMFTTAGYVSEAYDKMLNEGDYSRRNREANSVMGGVSGPYWAVVLGIYLLWSFLTMDWGTTWVVWPVAGVFYFIVSTIVNAFLAFRKKR